MRYVTPPYILSRFFFFNDTATTEIYTLSLHDALPICHQDRRTPCRPRLRPVRPGREVRGRQQRSARADPRDWSDLEDLSQVGGATHGGRRSRRPGRGILGAARNGIAEAVLGATTHAVFPHVWR